MQYIMFILGIVLTFLVIVISRKKFFNQKYNKYIVAATSSILLALFLEIFTFNFVCFETNNGIKFSGVFDTNTRIVEFENGNEVNANPSEIMKLNVVDQGETLTYETEIEINSELKDLDISVDSKANKIPYELYYKDEAIHSAYNKVDIDESVLVKGIPSLGHIKPHFAGKTSSIKLVFTADANEPISKIHVKVNEPAGFDFNVARFLGVFLITFLIYLFALTKDCVTIKKPIFMGLILLQLLFMIFLSAATNAKFDETGKFTGVDYHSDGSLDPYQELTLALAQGKVDLNGIDENTKQSEQQGIEELQKLENTYEWGQRSGISYKWDRAFYNGKYYCYFGIVPALFVYLPMYLLTGTLVNTRMFTLLLVMLSALLMIKLVMTIAKRRKKPINMWILLGTGISFVNASMVLYCINGSKFYEIATVSALVCALAGIDCILNAFVDKGIKKKLLMLGAVFMALSVGCRPNYILVSFIIAPIVLNGFAKNGGYSRTSNLKDRCISYVKAIFHKNNVKAILAFIIPYIIIGLGLMYYNYIRFDSITEFGAKYQLTVYDTSYYHMTDLGKLPIAIAQDILMLPHISSVFPYVNPVSEASNYVGYFYDIAYLGILSSPIMWLIFMVPWSLKRGVKEMKNKGFVIASLVVGLIMCFITTAMGGSSLRYSVDFAWMFFIPVIYVIFDIYTKLKAKDMEKYAFIGLGALMIATIIVNALVCISPGWSSIKDNTPEIFYRLEEMVVFWK